MKTSVRFALLCSAVMCSYNLHAATVSVCPNDSGANPPVNYNDDVTLDSITAAGGGPELLSKSYNATTCLHYAGNDNGGGGFDNFGYFEEGFMNYEEIYSMIPGISDELQDLRNDGTADDPGYIRLGGAEENLVPSYNSIGSFSINEFLTLAFSCTNYKEQNECVGGTWSLDVTGSVEDIQAALGRPATFDHLTIVLKAGSGGENGNDKDNRKAKRNRSANNDTTGALIFDFDFVDIFAEENNPALNFLTPYSFSGTWSTVGLGNKGLSHISVWARDPLLTAVYAPATLGMAVLSMGLLAGFRRRK